MGASPFLCGWLCNCRPAMQGVAGYAVAVPRYREWLVMQLPSRDTGSGWLCNCRPTMQAAVQDALPLKSEHSGT